MAFGNTLHVSSKDAKLLAATLATVRANGYDECYIRPFVYLADGGWNLTLDTGRLVGFEALADITEQIAGDARGAQRWRDAAAKLKTAYLSHPRHALIERGGWPKRGRLLSILKYQ